MKRVIRRWVVLSSVCLGLSAWTPAAPVSSVGIGNWETASTWSSDPALPGADDDVTITHTVTVTGTVD